MILGRATCRAAALRVYSSVLPFVLLGPDNIARGAFVGEEIDALGQGSAFAGDVSDGEVGLGAGSRDEECLAIGGLYVRGDSENLDGAEGPGGG